MKQVVVGSYEAGYDQFELVLRGGDGGEFYLIPEPGAVPRIKVGADQEHWDRVVMVYIHEVMELIFDRMRARYSKTNQVLRDHASYLFVFDHCQFTEMSCQAGEFISQSFPDLADAWRKWTKGKTFKDGKWVKTSRKKSKTSRRCS